jgi:hypothetical protein
MPAANELSDYERKRARTIAANEKVLESLGLQKRPALAEGRSPPAKRHRATTATNPTRRSSRQAPGAAVVSNKTAQTPPLAWHLQVFADAEEASATGDAGDAHASCAIWDARRLHQHLERSASGRSVATTGVAGYGVALCAQRASADACSWEVRAIRFGVGGFSVGVVRAGMRPPYKSLGTAVDAVGVYLSSGSLRSGGEERTFGRAYQQGDNIGVMLRRSHCGKVYLDGRLHTSCYVACHKLWRLTHEDCGG